MRRRTAASDHDAFGREAFDDALDVGLQRLAVGVVDRARDSIGDVEWIVASVAVGEDQGGGEIEVVGSGPGAVSQQKASAYRVEADIGASSGVATPPLPLHITKLSKSKGHATP